MDQARTDMLSAVDSGVRIETQTVEAPHNAVKAEAMSVFAGSRCLLADTELKIAEQPRLIQVQTAAGEFRPQKSGTCFGLVGPNGCGKSTLLRLIAERQAPVPPTWDVFLVSQHLPTPLADNPVEEVLSAETRRMQLLSQQTALQEEVARLTEDDLELLLTSTSRLEEVHNELLKWDGAERDVADILMALGFRAHGEVDTQGSEPTVATPMSHLSGGWRMKVQLAKALWLQPRLLLLDEPTNHLDFHALQWLEQRLDEYPYTSVVVSHDVSFLHSVCHEILHIKDQKVQTLPRSMVSQEDLVRMQRRRPLHFRFQVPDGADAADHGLSLHGVEFGYGGSSGSDGPAFLRVQGDIRFSGRSRSVVMGKNGSGKSTFLKLCVGDLQPSRGRVDRTPELQVGYYSQLTEGLDRHPADTAAAYLVRECREALAAHARSTHTTRLRAALSARSRKAEETQHLPSSSVPEPSMAEGHTAKAVVVQEKQLLEVARSTLSSFGFEGDVAASVPIERLSGGQKACLKFAALSLMRFHILVLDEPTNHLDAEACEALARGLSAFKGGVVAVTHDELLIYRLIQCNWSASELLTCRNGCLRSLRSFGAGCLDALKKEVRGAEEEEGSGRRQRSDTARMPTVSPPSTSGTKSARTAALPPWLARAPRGRQVAGSAEREAHGTPGQADEVAVASASQEPPAGKQMPKLKPSESTRPAACLPVSGTEPKARALPLEHPLDVPTPSRALASLRSDGQRRHAQMQTAGSMPGPVAALESIGHDEVPDSWEELTDDTTLDSAIQGASVASVPEPKCTQLPSSQISAVKRVASDAFQVKRTVLEQSDLRIHSPAVQVNDAEQGRGRHSRLRKDLINLNKAVGKWLRQEELGETSRSTTMDRIRHSYVARQLRAMHGSGYQEERFVLDVLERSAASDTMRITLHRQAAV